jgi:hypothetical protein
VRGRAFAIPLKGDFLHQTGRQTVVPHNHVLHHTTRQHLRQGDTQRRETGSRQVQKTAKVPGQYCAALPSPHTLPSQQLQTLACHDKGPQWSDHPTPPPALCHTDTQTHRHTDTRPRLTPPRVFSILRSHPTSCTGAQGVIGPPQSPTAQTPVGHPLPAVAVTAIANTRTADFSHRRCPRHSCSWYRGFRELEEYSQHRMRANSSWGKWYRKNCRRMMGPTMRDTNTLCWQQQGQGQGQGQGRGGGNNSAQQGHW